MKLLSFLPLLLVCCIVRAQSAATQAQDGVSKQVGDQKKALPASFSKNTTIATLSLGFINEYRNNYTVPAGFKLGNTSGFAPIYGRVEYGVSDKVSIGATAYYDVFYSNYFKLYQANGSEYKRYHTDKFRQFSLGFAAYYHLKKLIPIKKLDAFIGLGLNLNNINHTNKPQGDSTVKVTDHTVSPILKAGARYYLSNRGSVFADIGFDKKTLFSLGFSCRFSYQ